MLIKPGYRFEAERFMRWREKREKKPFIKYKWKG
jgi:hypothetical protein